MSTLLVASSPVEIEAEADELGLDPAARGAALHLFHDLTSRLELAAVELRGEGGTEWPHHRFFFGHVEDIVSALRARPEALSVTGPPPAGTAAPVTLFIEGADAGFTAVLVACADPALLDAIGRDM